MLYLIQRSTPKGSHRWQSPGYFAVVEAGPAYDLTKPLSAASLKLQGARVIETFPFSDSRYTGPRSSYGRALAQAEMLIEFSEAGYAYCRLGVDENPIEHA